MSTLILTGGGTAGHVIPHLSILPYLQKKFDKIYYIGSENGIEKTIIQKAGIKYYSVPCAKLNRKFTLKNFTIPFKVSMGIIKAKKLIDKLKPDVVFSKGGYVSVPVVIASKTKGIPVVSHESDFTVGLANKITSKYCKKVLTTFPETASTLSNGVHVGPPIRDSLLTASKSDSFKYFGFTGEKPVLLVTGGSLGSMAINNVMKDAIYELLPKYDIIHLVGKGNGKNFKKKDGYYVAEFIDNMEKAFSISSVCVARAGSNTLFELLALKIPCVLIPLPKGASRGDQIVNAEYFLKKGMVNVLFQEDLTVQSFVLSVNSAYSNRFNIKRNLDKSPIQNASKKIADIIYDCKR